VRSNARVFPCGRPAWVRARLDARLPCARSPHCAGVTSLVRIRSSRRRPPPCAARDREEAPDGRGASGIETRGRARRSPGRPARATPPPSRKRGRRAAGSVQTPPRGPPGHTPTRGSTRSTRGQVRRRARRQAGAAAGPRAAPAPAATSALCARARALRPPRRGHARGPRPLASETKKRRKTSYRKTSERNRKTAIPACP
jgi:hypothetical protein